MHQPLYKRDSGYAVYKKKMKILIFLLNLAFAQLDRERGQCFNFVPSEVTIVNQTSWNTGGYLFVTLDLSNYEDDILQRRAGVVNDRTFFEIGISARGDFGRQARLKVDKPRPPLSRAQLAGNFFQYDLGMVPLMSYNLFFRHL